MTEFRTEKEDIMCDLPSRGRYSIQDIYDESEVVIVRVGVEIDTPEDEKLVFLAEASSGEKFPFLYLDKEAGRIYLPKLPEKFRHISYGGYIKVLGGVDPDYEMSKLEQETPLIFGLDGICDDKWFDRDKQVMIRITNDPTEFSVRTTGYKGYTLFSIMGGFELSLKTGMHSERFDLDGEGRINYEEIP